MSAPDTSFYTISHKYVEHSTIIYETPFSPTARNALPACFSNHPKPHLVTSCPVDKPRSRQSHIRYPHPSRFSSRPRLIQPIPRQMHHPRTLEHDLNHNPQRHLGSVYTFSPPFSHTAFIRSTIAMPVAHTQWRIAACNLSAYTLCIPPHPWS